MCSNCVREYMLDGDEVPPLTGEMRFVANLISVFYTLDGCSVGGPLHVVLDDYNLEDNHLDIDSNMQYIEKFPPHVQVMATGILARLRLLTLAERGVAVDYGHYGDKSEFAA